MVYYLNSYESISDAYVDTCLCVCMYVWLQLGLCGDFVTVGWTVAVFVVMAGV